MSIFKQTNSNMKRILLILPVLALLSLDSSYSKFPQVTVKDLAGKEVSTSSMNNGDKAFIVSLWATWCAPCKQELSAMAAKYEQWNKESSVKVYAISQDAARSAGRVKPYVENQKWPFEVLIDSEGKITKQLGVNSIPHSLIVDKDGNILHEHSGYGPGDEDEMFKLLKEYNSK